MKNNLIFTPYQFITMKTTYTLWTSDDGYCLTCWTLWKCIDRLFYEVKHYDYRDIEEYSILKVKHPKNLTLDYWMDWGCYLLNENWEIDDLNDEILSKWKIIRLKKSDLQFIKNHLSIK